MSLVNPPMHHRFVLLTVFFAHRFRLIQKRHNRTFSEDDRIVAQEKVKNVEEAEEDDFSDVEDPMILQREARDWKVRNDNHSNVDCRSTC